MGDRVGRTRQTRFDGQPFCSEDRRDVEPVDSDYFTEMNMTSQE